MTREFNASRAQQNVGAFTIERLASSIAMKRLGPGSVSVLMTIKAALGRKELLDRNQFSVLGLSVGRAE
jgi:hypothetical protein